MLLQILFPSDQKVHIIRVGLKNFQIVSERLIVSIKCSRTEIGDNRAVHNVYPLLQVSDTLVVDSVYPVWSTSQNAPILVHHKQQFWDIHIVVLQYDLALGVCVVVHKQPTSTEQQQVVIQFVHHTLFVVCQNAYVVDDVPSHRKLTIRWIYSVCIDQSVEVVVHIGSV